MNKLTRDRVVPIISASVSWLDFCDHRLELLVFTEVGQQQKEALQALLA